MAALLLQETLAGCGGILSPVIQTEDGEAKRRTIGIADCMKRGPVTGRGWDTAGVTGSVILLCRASDNFTMENCTNEASIAAETTGTTTMEEIGQKIAEVSQERRPKDRVADPVFFFCKRRWKEPKTAPENHAGMRKTDFSRPEASVEMKQGLWYNNY